MRSGAVGFPSQHQELLQAVANQAALALRNAEHIERLTAENLVRALFEALDEGALDIAEARARAAGCDLDRPHVFIHARPVATGDEARPWPELAERVETRLRTLEAGALVDPGREALRALLPLPRRRAGRRRRRPARAGRRRGRRHRHERRAPGGDGAPQSLRQAQDASAIARALAPAAARWPTTRSAPTATSCTSSLDDAPHDRLCEAIERLLAYDERRETQLLATLEQYLADRRVGTTTARKLFIHANTLRQRLDRIQKLTGLDLAGEDLLSLELAVKLVRLRRAGGGESPPRS